MAMRPDDHRRKWDKKEFERKALDRIQKISKDKTEGKHLLTSICDGCCLPETSTDESLNYRTSWGSRASENPWI